MKNMKNWWLIAGGISIGIGISELANKNTDKKSSNGEIAFQLIGGALVMLGGIYMDE